MLGAVICDSAYYDLNLPGWNRPISFLSERVHTSRGDIDGRFFGTLASLAPTLENATFFAFLCGVLSHHILDRSLHPLIVYFTGDYRDPNPVKRRWSQARHRFLEGLIDLWVMREAAKGRDRREWLDEITTPGYSALSPCISLFIRAIVADGEGDEVRLLSRRLYRAVRTECALVRLFGIPAFRELSLILNRLAGGRLLHYAALCYADHGFLDIPLFSGKVTYRDPFTGEKRHTAMATLLDELVDTLAAAYTDLHRSLESHEGLPAPQEGPDWFESGGLESPRFFDTAIMDDAVYRFLKGEKMGGR